MFYNNLNMNQPPSPERAQEVLKEIEGQEQAVDAQLREALVDSQPETQPSEPLDFGVDEATRVQVDEVQKTYQSLHGAIEAQLEDKYGVNGERLTQAMNRNQIMRDGVGFLIAGTTLLTLSYAPGLSQLVRAGRFLFSTVNYGNIAAKLGLEWGVGKQAPQTIARSREYLRNIEYRVARGQQSFSSDEEEKEFRQLMAQQIGWLKTGINLKRYEDALDNPRQPGPRRNRWQRAWDWIASSEGRKALAKTAWYASPVVATLLLGPGAGAAFGLKLFAATTTTSVVEQGTRLWKSSRERKQAATQKFEDSTLGKMVLKYEEVKGLTGTDQADEITKVAEHLDATANRQVTKHNRARVIYAAAGAAAAITLFLHGNAAAATKELHEHHGGTTLAQQVGLHGEQPTQLDQADSTVEVGPRQGSTVFSADQTIPSGSARGSSSPDTIPVGPRQGSTLPNAVERPDQGGSLPDQIIGGQRQGSTLPNAAEQAPDSTQIFGHGHGEQAIQQGLESSFAKEAAIHPVHELFKVDGQEYFRNEHNDICRVVREGVKIFSEIPRADITGDGLSEHLSDHEFRQEVKIGSDGKVHGLEDGYGYLHVKGDASRVVTEVKPDGTFEYGDKSQAMVGRTSRKIDLYEEHFRELRLAQGMPENQITQQWQTEVDKMKASGVYDDEDYTKYVTRMGAMASLGEDVLPEVQVHRHGDELIGNYHGLTFEYSPVTDPYSNQEMMTMAGNDPDLAGALKRSAFAFHEGTLEVQSLKVDQNNPADTFHKLIEMILGKGPVGQQAKQELSEQLVKSVTGQLANQSQETLVQKLVDHVHDGRIDQFDLLGILGIHSPPTSLGREIPTNVITSQLTKAIEGHKDQDSPWVVTLVQLKQAMVGRPDETTQTYLVSPTASDSRTMVSVKIGQVIKRFVVPPDAFKLPK